MKIICVARNYADHAAEMKAEAPKEPALFLKPSTALLQNNKPFYHPDISDEIHHEIEIVYRVGKHGKYIAPEFAWLHIDAVGIGLDLTARDLQAELKEKRLPWDIAKAFNHSAVVSELFPLEEYPDHPHYRFRLEVNGEQRQAGDTHDMIFDLPAIVARASRFFTLLSGDLIFTGTPAGVGPIRRGDRVCGFLEDRKLLDFAVK